MLMPVRLPLSLGITRMQWLCYDYGDHQCHQHRPTLTLLQTAPSFFIYPSKFKQYLIFWTVVLYFYSFKRLVKPCPVRLVCFIKIECNSVCWFPSSMIGLLVAIKIYNLERILKWIKKVQHHKMEWNTICIIFKWMKFVYSKWMVYSMELCMCTDLSEIG